MTLKVRVVESDKRSESISEQGYSVAGVSLGEARWRKEVRVMIVMV
jgi:hypothetical protein